MKRLVAQVPRPVREALQAAPARPNVTGGVRAALLTVVPLALAPILHRPEPVWTSFAGFSAALVDKGGLHRTRAVTIGGFTLASALAAVLGALASTHQVAAVLLVLLGISACGFLRAFGAEATGVGLSTATTLLFSLATPTADVRAALVRGLFVILGGAWAMLIALFLWPIRVFRPVRLAVASSMRVLSDFASFLSADGSPESEEWQTRRTERVVLMRSSIEGTRAVLGTFRRGRPGASVRGEQLLVLLESVDLLFATLVALGESYALAHDDRASAPLRAQLRQVLAQLSAEVVRVADSLEAERMLVPSPTWNPEAIRTTARSLDDPSSPERHHDCGLLLRLVDELEVLLQTARAVDDPNARHAARKEIRGAPGPERTVLETVRENLTLDSVILRHALRAGLCTALAMWLARGLHLGHGYWATITCLIILQPYGSATFLRALQRVGGTIVGAGLATLVAVWMRDPHAIMVLVFVSAAVSVAVLPINYGLYTVFLTPTFVLLAESAGHDWSLAKVRVVNTVIGSIVALIGMRLLFPFSERDRFPAQMAEALRSARVLLDVARAPQPNAEALRAARSRTGLALVNAEASFQRLLAESSPSPEEHEALLTLLLYTHRMVAGLIALAVLRRDAPEGDGAFARQMQVIADALAELEAAVASGRVPAPLPPGVAERVAEAPSSLRPRLERLLAQLAVQHAAVLRWRAAHG